MLTERDVQSGVDSLKLSLIERADELKQVEMRAAALKREHAALLETVSDYDQQLNDSIEEVEAIQGELEEIVFELPVADEGGEDDIDFSSLPENLKSGALRKYRGSNKSDDEYAEEQNIAALIKEYKSRLEGGESVHEIALTIAQAEFLAEEELAIRLKVHSPDRTFGDLLEESERRKEELEPQSMEKTWSDDEEEYGEEDLILLESESSKNWILSMVMGVVAVAVAVLIYFHVKGGDDAGVIMAVDEEGEWKETDPDDVTGVVYTSPDKAAELRSYKAGGLSLLKEFNGSSDLAFRASLCRFPNRVLRDMKVYYTTREMKKLQVEDFKISPKMLRVGGKEYLEAGVLYAGEDEMRPVYFSKGEDGALRLDWHHYVRYEVSPWDRYLEGGDVRVQDRYVMVNQDGYEHPDYSEDDYVALKVRGWGGNAVNLSVAYLSKKHPMCEKLLLANNNGQKLFILSLRHINDVTRSLVVEDVVSLSEFYESDLEGGAEGGAEGDTKR